VEIAVTMTNQGLKTGIGVFFFLVALIFVYRSFYRMRIPEDEDPKSSKGAALPESPLVLPHHVKGEKVPVGAQR
jgi:K(+)-stimulated pyrophosphate-energized sodium pump